MNNNISYKKPRIIQTPTELSRKERDLQIRQSYMRVAKQKFREQVAGYELGTLTLQQLESVAEFGHPNCFSTVEYVDDRNIIQARSGQIHNGTEIMGEERYRVFRDVETARKLGGYRMMKRMQMALKSTDPRENKRQSIKRILDYLPEIYSPICQYIMYHDIEKLVELTIDSYKQTIKTVLVPLIVYRSSKCGIHITPAQVAKDMNIPTKGYMKALATLQYSGLLAEDTGRLDKDALVNAALNNLFLLARNETYGNLVRHHMDDLRNAIIASFDLYQQHLSRVTVRVEDIYLFLIVRKYLPTIQLKELAKSITKSTTEAIKLYKQYKNLVSRNADLLSIIVSEPELTEEKGMTIVSEIVDEVLDYVLDEVAMDIEQILEHLHSSQQEVNEMIIIGMEGELMRSHQKFIEQSQGEVHWLSAYSPTVRLAMLRQLRMKPLSLPVPTIQMMDTKLKYVQQLDTNFETLQRAVKANDCETLLVDDLRPFVQSHLIAPELIEEIETVLKDKSKQLIAYYSTKIKNRQAIKEQVALDLKAYRSQLLEHRQTYKRSKSVRTKAELRSIYSSSLPGEVLEWIKDHTHIRMGWSTTAATYLDRSTDPPSRGFNPAWDTNSARDSILANLPPPFTMAAPAGSEPWVEEFVVAG